MSLATCGCRKATYVGGEAPFADDVARIVRLAPVDTGTLGGRYTRDRDPRCILVFGIRFRLRPPAACPVRVP